MRDDLSGLRALLCVELVNQTSERAIGTAMPLCPIENQANALVAVMPSEKAQLVLKCVARREVTDVV